MQSKISGMMCSILLALILGATSHALARDFAGVKVEDNVQVAGKELALNGAGIRTRLFFKVYVAALYTERPSREAAALISGPGLRRMTMTMLRQLDAETLYAALEEGLRNNLGEAERNALKPSIDSLAATMRAIGKVMPNDTVTLDFSSAGVSIVHNGTARGMIADEKLGPALLRVWLGEKPVEEALKQALLGR